MANTAQKSLFFIKSPTFNLTAIDFLKKRDFTVHTESNLAEAISQIIELNPDYLFIPLDFPDAKIPALPPMLQKYVDSVIIPYVEESTKESIKKLENSGFKYKISPPLGGPAVERTILKIQKDLNIDVLTGALPSTKKKKYTTQEILNIKSQVFSEIQGAHEAPTPVASNKYQKQKDTIRKKNELLTKAQIKTLNQQDKVSLKSNYSQVLQKQLIEKISTLQTASKIHSQNVADLTQAHCLLIQSESWCGYLMLHTEHPVSFSEVQPLISHWLQSKFENIFEFDESDHFQVSIQLSVMQEWAQKRADFFDEFSTGPFKNHLFLIAVKPNDMKMTVDEDHELIQLRLDQIPTDSDLNLSLYLHLPENKKYIIYTPMNQKLSLSQKKRLIEKSVDKLFTPLDFEKEYKKIAVENQMQSILQAAHDSINDPDHE